MSRSDVNFLDLPDELLLIILRKLSNIDVLYSLMNINNGRLDMLMREKTFSNTLNFVDIDNISLIDRFTTDILPIIHHNVQYFILQPVFMERILLTTIYPNLTELKLFEFDQQVALKYFTDDSSLRSVFEQQITSLILVNKDKHENRSSSNNYTRNVYAHILNFFKNLRRLNIIESKGKAYPGLSLFNLSPNTFHSSVLTDLYIHVETFNDCLYLLDGRLKQLTTLSIIIHSMNNSSTIVHKMDQLSNLKCFSLKSVSRFQQLDQILPLLRRMRYLENLTLGLRIEGQNKIIDDASVQNDILRDMPQLHSFTFYINTYADTRNLSHQLPQENLSIGQRNTISMINYVNPYTVVCSIFSLPFTFDYLIDLGNVFPDVVFSNVTYLVVNDTNTFRHEFFCRIARSFPLLKHLRVLNIKSQFAGGLSLSSSDHFLSYSMIEYSHLMSLNVSNTHKHYVEQFLMETRAYVPCLTELTVSYRHLKTATDNFTREITRRNCTKIKQLILDPPLDNAEDYSHYFPSL